MKYICQLHYPHWLFVTRTSHEGEEFEKGKTTTIKTSGLRYVQCRDDGPQANPQLQV